MADRTLKFQHPAYRDDIGDLSTIRPLPGPQVEQIDPFLFLNHHGPQVYSPRNRGLPFGPHPHRGFETVTFILDGELAHLDSGGGESIIRAGGIQWMTAGRGLVHAEVSPKEFKERGGPLEILQLWVNLPSRLKMVDPHYVGLQKADIPELPLDDGKVILNAVSGTWAGQRAPIQSLIDIHIATVFMSAGGRLAVPIPSARNIFLYIVRGDVRVAGEAALPHHLIEMNGDGDTLSLEATNDTVLLLGHAEPIGEPVVAHGPFVMNTHQEIREAMTDYQSGKFGGLSRL